MMSQSESVRFWYEVVADCLREHPSWPDDRSGMDALDAMMRAAFYEGWEHDCPHVEPVRCPRCEGVEMAQLPHTIGCPLAEAPQAEPASEPCFTSFLPCDACESEYNRTCYFDTPEGGAQCCEDCYRASTCSAASTVGTEGSAASAEGALARSLGNQKEARSAPRADSSSGATT